MLPNINDTGESETAKTLTETQATMKLFQEELMAIKSGSTSEGINLPLPGMPRGIQESGSSTLRLDEAGQRK